MNQLQNFADFSLKAGKKAVMALFAVIGMLYNQIYKQNLNLQYYLATQIAGAKSKAASVVLRGLYFLLSLNPRVLFQRELSDDALRIGPGTHVSTGLVMAGSALALMHVARR